MATDTLSVAWLRGVFRHDARASQAAFRDYVSCLDDVYADERASGTQHKKPPQLQPCNGRWLNGGGIWGVRPSGFTREGLRMHRATCAVVGSESLPTHAGRLLVWYGVSPLKNRGYSSFSARRPHQVHLDRMALIPPNALPTLRSGRRGPLRGPRSPGSASPRPGLPAWG